MRINYRWEALLKKAGITRATPLGPVILRITLGILWLEMGIQKLHPNFMKGLESKLRFWAEDNPYPWYKYFLENFAIPHWQAFGYQVMLGEILVGLSLIFGIPDSIKQFLRILNDNELLLCLKLCRGRTRMVLLDNRSQPYGCYAPQGQAGHSA